MKKIIYPERTLLANLPTPIEKIKTTFKKGINIYFKRDDLTGMELSGNKIRKLEFCIGYALKNGYTAIMTTGGLGSNHCRATAAACKKVGLNCYLLLRGDEKSIGDGNYFLMKMMGAKIRYISREEYKNNISIMQKWAEELKKEKILILPSGASNAIGCWGYIKMMEEINEYTKKTGLFFDTMVCAVGSGGTYAGLSIGNYLFDYGTKIIGFNVCDTAEEFKAYISNLFRDFSKMYEYNIPSLEINIIDGYVGKGYAISDKDRMRFLEEFAQKEGIFLDPVYTGKAMYGLVKELEKGNLKKSKNILFIHTGGIFGLFQRKNDFFKSSEFVS